MAYSKSRRSLDITDGITLSEDDGVTIYSFRFCLVTGDEYIEIFSIVDSGSIGVKLDGDVADRVTLTPGAPNGELDVDVQFANNGRGVRTVSLISRATPSAFSFLEIFVLSK